MGHGVLGKKWRLEADFRANPFAFAVRLISGMVATASTSKLRTEVSGLDLLEMLQFAPSLVTDSTGDIDLELQDRHEEFLVVDRRLSIRNSEYVFDFQSAINNFPLSGGLASLHREGTTSEAARKGRNLLKVSWKSGPSGPRKLPEN